MRYLHSLHYIHYHTQLAIPTVYDDSLSFYEIMNKTNLHFNHVIDDMNKNYEIIDQAFQEVLEKTNEWMEEAKAQADRAEQEANKSQASAEASQQAAEDARNQANRAETEANRAQTEADNAENSAADALEQANRAETEANRAHTEAGNAAASATEAQKQAAASANSAAQSAASATEAKNQADRARTEATNAANSASEANTQADRAQSEAEKSATSAEESAQSAANAKTQADAAANSATQAAQSATDAANSAKEAADTLDEAKETFVKKAGDTMSGKLTISYGGLSVDGSADISGDLNTGRLQVGKPDDHRDTHLYGNLYLNDMLNMSIGSNVALKFANLQDGLKLYAPLSFEPSPLRISNVGNPQNDFDAVNKITLDSEVTGINAELTDVNNQIAALTTKMGTAEKNITKNTSDIASLTNRVTTNETSINNINTEITNIKQDITTVEGDYVKKAGDTMTGNLTISTGGLNVTGGLSTDEITNTGKLSVSGLIVGRKGLEITIGSEGGISFQNVSEGVKLSVPIAFTNPSTISNLKTPGSEDQAANKEYVDNINTGVQAQIKDLKDNYLSKNGGTMSGTLDMGNNLITNLKEPAADQNAATKKYVDDSIATVESDISGIESTYLKLSGGTMSGDITMGTDAKVVFGEGHIIGGNNTLLFKSFQSLDADGAKIKMVGSPTDLMDAANKNYVDSQTSLVKSDIGTELTKYLPKAGGIMSGSIDMGGKRILNVGTPSINNDAATKGYVDNAIAKITPVDTSLFYNANNLMFHITHISDNLYKCDCYTDIAFNIDIKIINQGTKAQEAFPHPLEDFLIEKGFTFGSGNETFLQTVSLSSGVSAIISARLFNNNLVIYATVPQRVTSPLNVGLTLPISFLCSALISKNA